jgi:hypothetical protein
MAQKSIAQQIHELSQDGGLHDHSTGEQIRARLVKDFNVTLRATRLSAPIIRVYAKSNSGA